jgi:superfamily I DNA/RNA helicase
MKEKVDVLLIDEGQDFKRDWVQTLQTICASDYHLMFCEDRRQNIYRTEQMPLGAGRPYELNESYRIPEQTARLANSLSTWANQEGQFEMVKSIKPFQENLFVNNIWFNGTKSEALTTLQNDIKTLVKDKNTARADIAILVCTVTDGWQVCQTLDELNLPYQRNFESKEENKKLFSLFGHNKEDFKRKVEQLRRGYKAGFWMQGGRIKVCTIHSFKGWELSNILVFFNPDKKQNEDSVALLYTAITRSQDNLTIYNSEPELSDFGKKAILEAYIEQHPSKANS